MLFLARIVRMAASIVAGVIVVGILLYVLGANQSNGVVSTVMDAARWLVGPFDGLFHLSSAKWEIAVNWGIAAIVYSVIGSLIARLLASASYAGRGRRGWGWRRGSGRLT
jgi:hypothetical protein